MFRKSRQRWLVRGEGGFDLGPFGVEEMKERIREGRFHLDTEICPEDAGGWTRLKTVDALRKTYEDVREQIRLEEERRTDERVEQDVRRKHMLASRGSQLALAGLILAAAGTAIVLASPPDRAPSGYATGVFYHAELGRLPAMASFSGERAHEWRFGADSPLSAPQPARRARPRPQRSGFGGGALYEDDGGEALIIDFDMTGSDPAGGSRRQISNGALVAEVQPIAERLVAPCLEAEASRRPGLTEATFRFDVLPTGRIGRARVAGQATHQMHTCVRTSLRRLSVEPFAGVPLSMRLSLRVSRAGLNP